MKLTYSPTHDHRYSIKDESGLSIAVTHNQDEESKQFAAEIVNAVNNAAALRAENAQLRRALSASAFCLESIANMTGNKQVKEYADEARRVLEATNG
jgi:regulator of replication initiation timing